MMVGTESQDEANMRIQQLRERLELYNATINRVVGAGSASTTSDGAAKRSETPKNGAAVSNSSNHIDTHCLLPKAMAFNTASQKTYGPTKLASHLKKTNDSRGGNTLNSLKGPTESPIKKNKKLSLLKKTLNGDEKSHTEFTALVSKEHIDKEGKSEPALAAPTVSVATAKSLTPEPAVYSDFIDTDETKASNTGESPSVPSATVNDDTQRKAPLETTCRNHTHQTPFVGSKPIQGSPSSRVPPIPAVFQTSSTSSMRPTAAHRLWNLPSTTGDAGHEEGEHKINENNVSSEDTSTNEIDSENSSSGEEIFNKFLEKILAVNPSMENAVQETLSNSYSFLKHTAFREVHANRKAGSEKNPKKVDRFTPSRTSAKHLDTPGITGRANLPNRDPSRYSNPQSTPTEPNSSTFLSKSASEPLSPVREVEDIKSEHHPLRHKEGPLLSEASNDTGKVQPRKVPAPKVAFDQLEIAFQNLEAVVHTMQKVYRPTGLTAFPQDLPQAEHAAALASVRDRLTREEAELRVNPPKGPSLEYVRETSGVQVEGLARRLIQECEKAMDSLKDVEERRWKLQDRRQCLEMRRNELKERQKSRSLILDEIELLQKQNNEHAAALRDREKKYLEKLVEHSAQEKDIQDRIGEVEQLGHKITSWLRILEDRDTNLSAKEEKLRRVQADLQRRIKDVQAYKELKNRLETQALRREITSD
ncbi:unnamed protein product [Phytomonas sp. Hart1]|nr:unnamed protein product [Phytomonas sp. Hart1]|eukprot:CCW67958.1 unnamed protein product [Phytomonas sp. isolate Hart1]